VIRPGRRPGPWSLGLLAAALLPGCGEMPAVSPGPTHLQLVVEVPDSVLVHENAWISHRALDPLGRTVPVQVHWRSQDLRVSVWEEETRVGVTGQLSGRAWLRARIEDDRFSMEPVDIYFPVRYGNPSVVFLSRDTTLHTFATVEVRFAAVDFRNRPLPPGGVMLTIDGDWITGDRSIDRWTAFPESGLIRASVRRPGTARLVLGHSACDACADTVTVTVDFRAELPDSIRATLPDTIRQCETPLYYGLPGAPPSCSLWIRQHEAYDYLATWDHGSVAEIYASRFDPDRVRFYRHIVAGPGMGSAAAYDGERTGSSARGSFYDDTDGSVAWEAEW
jgi:hypothetical protein